MVINTLEYPYKTVLDIRQFEVDPKSVVSKQNV